MTVIEQPIAPSRDAVRSFAKRALFLSLALITLVTLYVHEAYLWKPADPEWAHLRPFRWWLVPHVFGGGVALLLGPLQFSSTLRRRYPAIHRWLGRVYVGAAVLGAGLSVYIVVVFEPPTDRWVMGVMGGLWLATTLFAWFAALNRKFDQHKLWMGRSYCFTLTFVATRFIPDIVLPGLDYFGTTALYWVIIVLCLIIPDLLMSGSAVSPWRPSRRNSSV